MKRALLLLTLLAVGCSNSRGEAPPRVRRHAIDYVARTVGDRVRVRVEPGGRFEHYGVTAQDARSRLIIHGTDRTTIELVEATPDSVWLVSPESVHLVPIVIGPIARGTTTRYQVDQGGSQGTCELAISATGRRVDVGGVRLTECIEQRRHCDLPPGGGLPQATAIDEIETLCPRVGRVQHRFRAEPPLPFEGVSSDQRTDVVSFVVAGTRPMPARTTLANRLIVLPSDIAAACGGAVLATELRASATVPPARAIPDFATPADARPTDVLLAFQLEDAPFVVEARPTSRDSLESYRDVGIARTGIGTRRGLVRLTPNAGCRDASRLLPLIQSLLR